MLTDEEKEFYALAKEIAEGKRSIYVVYEVFAQYPDTAAKIINFWMRCDEFTQSVAHYLAVEKARIQLEVCAEKEMYTIDLIAHNTAILFDNIKRGLKWMRKGKNNLKNCTKV